MCRYEVADVMNDKCVCRLLELSYFKEGFEMDIKEQFNFVAQEYDANRKKFIPCFEDYYEN